MRRSAPAVAICAFVLAVSAGARAQVVVVEEEDVPQEAIVERGYVHGVGRGIQYGAHVISPIYLMAMDRGGGGGESLGPGPGAGLHGRVGWEFPSGFTVELYGGFAFNALDVVPGEVADRGHVLSQADLGIGLRYMFFNETAVVPFVQLGAGGRWLGSNAGWRTQRRTHCSTRCALGSRRLHRRSTRLPIVSPSTAPTSCRAPSATWSSCGAPSSWARSTWIACR